MIPIISAAVDCNFWELCKETEKMLVSGSSGESFAGITKQHFFPLRYHAEERMRQIFDKRRFALDTLGCGGEVKRDQRVLIPRYMLRCWLGQRKPVFKSRVSESNVE